MYFIKTGQDVVVDDGAFVIGCEGILTEEETLHSLKVRRCVPRLLTFTCERAFSL